MTLEEKARERFANIWNCEIEHPKFQETVGEIVEETIELTKPQWIPVTERMPDEDDDVLVLIGCDCFVMRLVNRDKTDVWHGDGSVYMEWQSFSGSLTADVNDVTHWMPLPELPKEGME